jgi:hypothetical protein
MDHNEHDPQGRPMELEDLAAFLDNRLDDSARAEIVKRLVDSSSAYEVLAEAAAIQADIAASPTVVQTGARWKMRLWIPLSAAASIALFALLIFRMAGAASSLTRLDGAAVTLAANWYQTGWPVLRGGAPIVTPGVSFRVGVRLADLDLAIEARDRAGISLAANGLIDVLRRVDGASPIIADIESRFAQGSLSVPARAVDVWLTRARDIADARAVELGVWSEQARLAVRSGSTSFFTDHPIDEREFISTAAAISADAGQAMRAVARQLPAQDVTALGQALDTLIGEAGR